jgi:hypothetical protein
MRWLRAAIARLLGLQTQHLGSPVQPTQTAGLVPPEHTHQVGNKPSAQDTQPQRRSSPAQQPSQKKPKAARQTTAVSKGSGKKQEPAPTAKSRKAAGSSSPTPARRTRQHAK